MALVTLFCWGVLVLDEISAVVKTSHTVATAKNLPAKSFSNNLRPIQLQRERQVLSGAFLVCLFCVFCCFF